MVHRVIEIIADTGKLHSEMVETISIILESIGA